MTDAERRTLSTYRHLRLAMALLLALLLGAVALRAVTADVGFCLEGSISGYYFTSVRAVFVAALCALGTCLIVYRGNTDWEDIALNACGALAFVVAFVPTTPPQETGVARCSASNVPGPGELDAAVKNNVTAYFVVGAIALAVAIALLLRARFRGSQAATGWPLVALGGFATVLAVAVGVFATWPAGFRDNAHTPAAIAMFVGILAVVGGNAWSATREDAQRTTAVGYGKAYVVIVAVMAVTAVVLGVAHWQVSGWRHGIFWIESTLLAEYLVFWVIQTAELWGVVERQDLPTLPSA